MKKSLVCSLVILFLLTFWIGAASASQYTMEVIGTAEFVGITDINDPRYETEYKLIWDPDNNGNSLVWLDYTNHYTSTNWNDQSAWAAGLDTALNIILYSGYSVNWTDSTWRLPSTVDGPWQDGFDGSTTVGWNITTSEMGHLFYTEFGNKGYYDTDGNPRAYYGLSNTEDFENLLPSYYWSGTEHADDLDQAWSFDMANGEQNDLNKSAGLDGLAVRSGRVSTSPVPEPTTSLLLGIGLLGLAGFSSRRKGISC